MTISFLFAIHYSQWRPIIQGRQGRAQPVLNLTFFLHVILALIRATYQFENNAKNNNLSINKSTYKYGLFFALLSKLKAIKK